MKGLLFDGLLAEGWTPPPRDFFSEDTGLTPGYMLTWAVGVIGVGLVVWGIAWFVERRDRARTCDDPRALFGELCAAHGLDRSSRRLMIDLAGRQGIGDPARLFLRPDLFQGHGLDRALAGAARDERLAVTALGRRLFGQQRSANDARPHPTAPLADA